MRAAEMVRVWNLESGREIRRHPASTRFARALAFSPDGRRYAYVDGSVLHVRDLASGLEVATFSHEVEISAVTFSHDGRLIATAAGLQDLLGTAVDTTARLWRLPN
jgi:WD40 repeat protein